MLLLFITTRKFIEVEVLKTYACIHVFYILLCVLYNTETNYNKFIVNSFSFVFIGEKLECYTYDKNNIEFCIAAHFLSSIPYVLLTLVIFYLIIIVIINLIKQIIRYIMYGHNIAVADVENNLHNEIDTEQITDCEIGPE